MSDFNQKVIWCGTVVGEDKVREFVAWIKDEFDCRAEYVCEYETLADLEPGSGGRNDLMFAIHNDDVAKFAVPRLQFEMRWWEDCLDNFGKIIPPSIKTAHPRSW